MKRIKMNKYFALALGLFVAVALFAFGKGHDAGAVTMTAGAVISLTEEEKAGFSESEQKAFLAMKKMVGQGLEDFKKGIMSKDEISALVTQATKDFKESFTGEELKAIKDDLKKMDDIAKAQGTELADLKLKGNTSVNAETLLSVVEKHINDIKASTKKGKDFTFTIKADTLRSSITSNPSALDLKDIGQLAHRKLTVYDIFRKVPVPANSNGVVRYVDWDLATTVRAAAAESEGGTFNESTAKWATYTLNLEKTGDIIPMSVEMMYDAAMFAAELENFLRVNIQIVVDTGLVDGNGSSPNLNGIKNQIPNYTASAAGIIDASIYDLIVKVRESITSSYGSKYNPDVALMNITDINRMKLKKDQNNNYVLPPFYSASGNLVDGVTVIECNAFTANTMAVGDRRFGAIYEAGDVEIETGYATGDFESDMMSLKARKRLNLLIRNVDRTGWLEVTDIDAALTTLAS